MLQVIPFVAGGFLYIGAVAVLPTYVASFQRFLPAVLCPSPVGASLALEREPSRNWEIDLLNLVLDLNGCTDCILSGLDYCKRARVRNRHCERLVPCLGLVTS